MTSHLLPSRAVYVSPEASEEVVVDVVELLVELLLVLVAGASVIVLVVRVVDTSMLLDEELPDSEEESITPELVGMSVVLMTGTVIDDVSVVVLDVVLEGEIRSEVVVLLDDSLLLVEVSVDVWLSSPMVGPALDDASAAEKPVLGPSPLLVVLTVVVDS